MTKTELPILIHQLAFLQAYLYEIFGGEKKCENNFKHTKWYLKENFTDKKIDLILEFFNSYGLKCDCDILKKFDLKNYSSVTLNFHS